jgi:hypothetical protein
MRRTLPKRWEWALTGRWGAAGEKVRIVKLFGLGGYSEK